MPIMKIESEVAGNGSKGLGSPGQTVAKGETILILESMKMEIPVDSPALGRIVSIDVVEETVVEEGQLVARIEA